MLRYIDLARKRNFFSISVEFVFTAHCYEKDFRNIVSTVDIFMLTYRLYFWVVGGVAHSRGSCRGDQTSKQTPRCTTTRVSHVYISPTCFKGTVARDQCF